MGKEQTSNQIDLDLRRFKRLADNNSRLEKFDEGLAVVFDIQSKEEGQLPVFFVQGWGANEPRYRKMKIISDAGHQLVAIHPRPFGLRKVRSEAEHGIENERKAQIYLKTIKRKGITKTNVIAVSGSASSALIAALSEPELMESVVLVNPVGINGSVKKRTLIRRFLGRKVNRKDMHLRDRHVDMSPLKAGREFFLHLFGDPKRTVTEINDMSEVDTYALCRKVAEKGVKISLICSKDDTVFPLREMYENFEKTTDEEGNSLILPFHKILIMDGDHDENSLLQPSRIAAAVDLLHEMNSAKSRLPLTMTWGSNS